MAKDDQVKPPKGLTAKQSKNLFVEWEAEISAYERDSENWVSRSEKIIDRYRDSRRMRKETRAIRYNILWANVQVLRPALYARDPIPRVQRRFKQKDAPSRIGAEIQQHCLSYLIECGNFNDAMKSAVLDRLLSGRGSVWIRYEPTFDEVEVQTTDDKTGKVKVETEQQLTYEKAIPDYIHWKDFGHTYARTWEELRGVWRITYLDREALVSRFGDVGKHIPLTHTPDEEHRKNNRSKSTEADKKAVVYEIWDKDTERAIWLCKEYPEGVLDALPDPLELEGFFPCPKPLYATLANDDLIPTPDFVLYQDQATELDELSERISLIVSALRVAGVYDANTPGIQRLLTEGTVDNKMIPVSNWAMFAEKGGLKSAMDLLPTLDIARTLMELYRARDSLKQDIYEITGMSDIVRGATDSGETATAQQIKSQYANLRLQESQKDVERFARDLLRIMADLVSSKFSQQTLSNMSGVVLLTEEQKAKAMQQAQMAEQAQQPVPPELQEMLQRPTWEEVMGILRDDQVRSFRIEVETDSTIATDEKDEKEGLTEFMTAMGQVMAGLSEAAMNGVLPKEAGKQIMMTILRKFRFGDEVEEAFDQAGQEQDPTAAQQAELQKKGEELQAKEQELMKAEQDVTQAGAKLQNDQAQFQTQVDSERASIAMDRQSLQTETKAAQSNLQSEFKVVKAEFDAMRTMQKADEKLMTANIQAMITKLDTAKQPKPNGSDK